MANKTGIGLGLGIAGVVGAVGYYFYQQTKLIEALCYEVGYIEIKGTKDGVTSLTLLLNIYNYSKLPIYVYGYGFDIILDGTRVATTQALSSEVLKPQSVTGVPIPINIQNNLMVGAGVGIVIDAITGSKDKTLRIYGGLTAGFNKIIRVDNYRVDETIPMQQVLTGIKKGGKKCQQ